VFCVEFTTAVLPCTLTPHAGKDQIERLLALGASRTEATADLLSRSVKLAMTPLLNQMSVVGLVSIPGMMTGQVRGRGRGVVAAARLTVIWWMCHRLHHVAHARC
jgi:ABC-type iron transport system FetAB permease component